MVLSGTSVPALSASDFGISSLADMATAMKTLAVKSEIPENADLNNYYAYCGLYGINLGGIGAPANILNYPNNDEWKAGQLLVYSGTINGGGYQKTQILISTGSTKATYIRYKWADIWYNWQRIDNYGTSSLSELASALGVPSINVYNTGWIVYDSKDTNFTRPAYSKTILFIATGYWGDDRKCMSKVSIVSYSNTGEISETVLKDERSGASNTLISFNEVNSRIRITANQVVHNCMAIYIGS